MKPNETQIKIYFHRIGGNICFAIAIVTLTISLFAPIPGGMPRWVQGDLFNISMFVLVYAAGVRVRQILLERTGNVIAIAPVRHRPVPFQGWPTHAYPVLPQSPTPPPSDGNPLAGLEPEDMRLLIDAHALMTRHNQPKNVIPLQPNRRSDNEG